MTCHNCGAENPPAYKFCQNCGSPLDAPAPPDPPLDPPPVTTQLGNERNNNILLVGAIAAGVFVCLCVCSLFAGWFYFSQNANAESALPTRRSTPTRRATAAAPTFASVDEPTSTPAAAPTTPSPIAAKRFTTSQAVDAFRRAKLEIANPRPMTNDDYGNVPLVATEAIRFFLPSLGGQKGGRIYSFANASDLQTVKQYYESGASGAASRPWILVKDNILVQISGDLPENRAKQYQTALNTLR